jgi:hypothetical protein
MASSGAIDIYAAVKEKIRESGNPDGIHPKIVMSASTFNDLAGSMQEMQYNGQAHYLREFMQVDGCKVIISNNLDNGTFELIP